MAAKTVRNATAEENIRSMRAKLQLHKNLIEACTNRDVTAAKKAIIQGANINYQTPQNLTPLLIAAEHGDVDLIVLLCSQENRSCNLEERTIYGWQKHV